MADSNSPMFTPPMNRITDEQPDIVRVPMNKVEIGYRPSQQSGLMQNNPFKVANLRNGQ